MNVCMELIQICISKPISTKLCTCLPLGLEETVGYVWTRNSLPLRPFGPFFSGGHCRIMRTRWLPAQPFPRYPYIRDSSWCSRDVTDTTLSQTAVSSAAALCP